MERRAATHILLPHTLCCSGGFPSGGDFQGLSDAAGIAHVSCSLTGSQGGFALLRKIQNRFSELMTVKIAEDVEKLFRVNYSHYNNYQEGKKNSG